jgi:hypothetical protein
MHIHLPIFFLQSFFQKLIYTASPILSSFDSFKMEQELNTCEASCVQTPWDFSDFAIFFYNYFTPI